MTNFGLCDCRTAGNWHLETCRSRFPVAPMLTGEPDPVYSLRDHWRERAERAEARVAEVEAKLKQWGCEETEELDALRLAAETDRALAPKMKLELAALRAVAEAAEELVTRGWYLSALATPASIRRLRSVLAAWRATGST